MEFLLQTVPTGGGRAARVPQSSILVSSIKRHRRLCVSNRWELLAAFLLMNTLRRLGHRNIKKQKHSLWDVARAARMFKLWHYLRRDSDICTPYDLIWANYNPECLALTMHHTCRYGPHVWGPCKYGPHVLTTYNAFATCSSSCLNMIIVNAREILRGYEGQRLTTLAATRFVQIVSWRRNRHMRERMTSTLASSGSSEGHAKIYTDLQQ